MSDQSRMLFAIILSGLILFVWQFFYGPSKTTSTDKTQTSRIIENGEKNVHETAPVDGALKKSNLKEELSEVKSEDIKSVTLSFQGQEIEINSFLDIKNMKRKKSFQNLSDTTFVDKDNHSFSVLFNNPEILENKFKKVYFQELYVQGNAIRARSSKWNLDYLLTLNENGKFNALIKSSRNLKYKFIFSANVYNPDLEKASKHYDMKRVFKLYKNSSIHDFEVGSVPDLPTETTDKIKWAALDFNYHLFSQIFNQNQSLTYSINENQMSLITNNPAQDISFELLFTKKDYDYLSSLKDGLRGTVDFGIFSILAVPILKSLKWIYDFIPNYGFAIILLTIVMRFLVLPLHLKSFKSMKKMQMLTPELTKIKEKFKEDKPRIQKETMELFKRQKVNPMGGCLPIIAQMPIFFAFYQVLYHSAELVGAPFIFWISDLSLKDKFYLLPVLMSLSMFLQQMMTPSSATMDPTQRKMMMFMPIIFGFFMKDLPAGLTLYIFISTLFGIITQKMMSGPEVSTVNIKKGQLAK